MVNLPAKPNGLPQQAGCELLGHGLNLGVSNSKTVGLNSCRCLRLSGNITYPPCPFDSAQGAAKELELHTKLVERSRNQRRRIEPVIIHLIRVNSLNK